MRSPFLDGWNGWLGWNWVRSKSGSNIVRNLGRIYQGGFLTRCFGFVYVSTMLWSLRLLEGDERKIVFIFFIKRINEIVQNSPPFPSIKFHQLNFIPFIQSSWKILPQITREEARRATLYSDSRRLSWSRAKVWREGIKGDSLRAILGLRRRASVGADEFNRLKRGAGPPPESSSYVRRRRTLKTQSPKVLRSRRSGAERRDRVIRLERPPAPNKRRRAARRQTGRDKRPLRGEYTRSPQVGGTPEAGLIAKWAGRIFIVGVYARRYICVCV